MGISKEYAATLRALTPAEAAKDIAKTYHYLTLEEACEMVCEADFDDEHTDEETTLWVDKTLAAMEDCEFAPEDEDEEEDEDEDDTYCFE